MLRFVLGMAELTNERVGAVLAACTAVEPPAPLEPTGAGAPFDLRHAALGLLAEAVSGASARTPRG